MDGHGNRVRWSTKVARCLPLRESREATGTNSPNHLLSLDPAAAGPYPERIIVDARVERLYREVPQRRAFETADFRRSPPDSERARWRGSGQAGRISRARARRRGASPFGRFAERRHVVRRKPATWRARLRSHRRASNPPAYVGQMHLFVPERLLEPLHDRRVRLGSRQLDE
jgi:hypothetical protein